MKPKTARQVQWLWLRAEPRYRGSITDKEKWLLPSPTRPNPVLWRTQPSAQSVLAHLSGIKRLRRAPDHSVAPTVEIKVENISQCNHYWTKSAITRTTSRHHTLGVPFQQHRPTCICNTMQWSTQVTCQSLCCFRLQTESNTVTVTR